MFPTNKNLAYGLAGSMVFLIATLGFRAEKRLSTYWQIPLVLLAASLAYPVTAIFSSWNRAVLGWFAAPTDTSKGLAIEKACAMLLKTFPMFALSSIGRGFGSVFLGGTGWFQHAGCQPIGAEAAQLHADDAHRERCVAGAAGPSRMRLAPT